MICTHPDIAYSVGILSQHVTCPEFQSNNSTPSSLKAFIDSDWVGDRVDRKSISGFIVMLDQGAVSWGSTKQTSVSLSMVEAEFVAAVRVTRAQDSRRILS